MNRKLFLTVDQWREMQRHVESQIPHEACGLLAGKSDRVEKVLPVANQARSPVRFEMEAYEQLNAFQWIDANGLDLIGIFHSHPSGPQTASPTDIAEAAYDVVHVIVAPGENGWLARGFWIERNEAMEVQIEITA